MRVRGKKLGVFVTSFMVLAALVFAWWSWESSPGYMIEPGYYVVEKAYRNHQSGMMVDVSGQVVRVLTDDQAWSQYQRFVISLYNGQRLLVLHDIKAAEDVPAEIGDVISVRGEYRWSEPGGSISRTHRDYGLDRRHGWIKHKENTYN